MKYIPLLLSIVLTTPTLAAEPKDNDFHCLPLSKITDINKYRTLTHDEWTAMRTIFRIDPHTPDSWPPGSTAKLMVDPASKDAEKGDIAAILLFIDGNQACSPMPLTKQALDMLDEIRTGKIVHLGHPS